jgi:hypothetical protein
VLRWDVIRYLNGEIGKKQMILNDTMAYGPIAFNDEMEILISKNGEEEMG